MFLSPDQSQGAIPRIRLWLRSWLVSNTNSLVATKIMILSGSNYKLKNKIMIRVQGYVQDYDVVRLNGDLST
jgi:hypothetical protein